MNSRLRIPLESSSHCTAVPGTRVLTKCSNTNKPKLHFMESIGFFSAGFEGRHGLLVIGRGGKYNEQMIAGFSQAQTKTPNKRTSRLRG